METRKLVRSVRDRKIAGICGGLAEYFAVDSTIVRLFLVLLVFASFGLAIILYFVCAFVIPKEVPS
ncbi:MAG: PspC domain-containing protein [Bacteroidetes bacterium]|nr:PspC domain-containing protein [Bacteroidota bacterium]MCL5034363.1 PspC domain-containing protein [Bacteroidota bacterium]